MFKRLLGRSFRKSSPEIGYCSNGNCLKIAICGAAGRVGQMCSLFLKQSRFNLFLSLHDISPNLSNICRQLNMINTKNKVEHHIGPMRLRATLKDANIVIILARSKNNTRASSSDSFELNFPIVAGIAKNCIEVCPGAILAIATHPINCIVPAVDTIYKNLDVWYSNKVIGITSLDSLLARSIYAELFDLDPDDVFVPLVGGTTIDTILPLFSLSRPPPHKNFQREDSERLTNMFFDQKAQQLTSELAAAISITRLIESIIRSINGEEDIVEIGFVPSSASPLVKFATSLIDLGPEGVMNAYAYPASVSRYERRMMAIAMNNLQKDLTLVEKYMASGDYKYSTKLKSGG